MARYMLMDIMGAQVRARLLDEAAPETCRTVWSLLPYLGDAGHALQSGTNAAFHFDPSVLVPVENATCLLQRGDVVFIRYDPGTRHNAPSGVSEVVWCYDRYNPATTPGRMNPPLANVFASLVGDYGEFAAMSARLLSEGRKPITVTPVEA
jgi:hypothetical protein